MISVVIPTHNRSDLLIRAVESVQKQTIKDLEIIVVSDGSEDDTKEIVEKLQARDNRIRFIEYYPARGGNIARNTGIEASNGEYIAFLDDDDEWMENKLEKQLEVMLRDSSIGLVYTGVNIIYVNEGIEYDSIGKNQGNLSQKILLDNCIGTTSTVMVKKTILEKAGVFDVKLKALQDFDLWIRVCQYCNVGVVPEKLINYYNYTGKIQVSSSTQKYLDAFAIINEKYADQFAKLPENLRKEKMQNEYMLLMNKAMRNGDGKLSRSYVKKALRCGFSKKAAVYYILSFTSFKTVLKVRSKI